MESTNILRNRALLEGNFVLSLYNNPLEFYADYPIDVNKDLLTEDGKFYYNLGYNMKNKGIKNFNEISFETFLSDFPKLKKEYDIKGGWKSIEEAMIAIDGENINAYYEALIKNNLLIELQNKGFLIEKNLPILNSLNSADEIIDYYEAVLNTVALKATHDLKLENLNLTENDLKEKKKGFNLGLQFGEECPLLNSFCLGIPRQGMTMFASYTNGGKSSFVFGNIVLPLAKNKIKVCFLSNEQNSIDFKDLLYIYVLTHELNYWEIDRNKMKTANFNSEEEKYFKKANEIVKEKYLPYLKFERFYSYNMKEVKRTIKKLSKQGFQLFVYDTFKVENTTDSIWQSFLNDSKELFQVCSKENVGVITPVQLALSTKGKIRWLNESALSNSKQISEIYEEIFMFRDIWQDEYMGMPQDIHPFKIIKDENGTFNNQREKIEIKLEEGKHYKLFFHTKSRNGEAGRTVLYDFQPKFNKWNELGMCFVGDENKI